MHLAVAGGRGRQWLGKESERSGRIRRAAASGGPVAQSWPEQIWTPAESKALIGRRFHKGCTVCRHTRDVLSVFLRPQAFGEVEAW
ncbi:hypothetical protein ABT316_27470 [Streptomyces cellulosae]